MDALSAPIQFMSQAEKRAKQMQEMGIDASDITVPVTKGHPVAATGKSTPTSTNGRVVATSVQPTQQATSNMATSSTQGSATVEKKKGLYVGVIGWTLNLELCTILLNDGPVHLYWQLFTCEDNLFRIITYLPSIVYR